MDIKTLYENPSRYTNISLKGFVRTMRVSKNLGFIELNDGTYFKSVQIVFESENFKEIPVINTGSGIEISGKVVMTPASKQPFEIKADKFEILAPSTPDYPLQKKRHSFEFLRTISHLRPRTNTFSAVFRVRSKLAFAIHKFFNENNFIYVNTPIISSGDAEGAGEIFKIAPKDFFNKECGLTVSGQLNAEAYALAFKKVYTFGPTFRAEKSNTTRHAAEFWMVEPEIAFADLEDDINLATEMFKYIFKYVLENSYEDLEFLNEFVDKTLINRLEKVLNIDFKKITYTEAIEILNKYKDKFEYEPKWGNSLQTEHERFLTENIFDCPLFVIDYPKEIKAFYMRLNDDNKTVAAMDLLVGGIGEIIGGSQREERLDLLESRMKNMNIEEYSWYLDLRKYGGVKHAGFGLGFERAVMFATGMSNIRDVIPFPRTVNSADF